MELKQIQCFVAAAETLNFTLAAERMYLSQPSLCRHNQNLEDELGISIELDEKVETVGELTELIEKKQQEQA